VDAATKGDFTAFQDASRAERRGTPQAAVDVTPPAPVTPPAASAPEAAVTPPAPVTPQLSKRQQEANERTRLAVEHATADLRAENERLRAQAGTPPAQTPPAPAEPEWKRFAAMPDAPKLADFESVEDHTAAMSYFIATTIQQETQTAAQRDQFETQRQRFLTERSDKYTANLQAAADADPEFLNKIPPAVATARPLSGLAHGERATFANVAAEAAFRSEHPDVLLTYLHAHQDEVVTIASLPPSEWLPSLIHLDGRLSGSPTPAAPAAPAPAASALPSPISAAPPPPPTIQRAGSSADPKQVALENGDYASMQQHWRAERAAKRATA
jgi:hypothetical protein